MKRTTLQTMFIIGLGAGLGYLAATCRLGTPRAALASAGAGTSAVPADETRGGKNDCSDGSSRIGLLTVATTGLVAQPTALAQAGKKPNILVIWGDDIGT